QVIMEGFRFVVTDRIALCYTLASTVIFGGLFGFINSAQQIYVDIYGLGAWFPLIFAIGAGLMAVSSFTNARLVGRFGMRRLSHGALIGFIVVNGIWLALSLAGDRKSTRLNSSHVKISYAVFCLKKKTNHNG